jgi:hypothetical protein
MKIFGKRKATKSSSDGVTTDKKPDESLPDQTATTAAPETDHNIPSYFSNTADNEPSKKKKPKKNASNEINGEEMEKLLHMEYDKLNSKQRRLVRRYKERSGEDCEDPNAAVDDGSEKAKTSNKDESNDDSKEKESDTNKHGKPDELNDMEKELLAKLDFLNSKDRRKFLRQLRTDNPNNVDIDKLEEEAKRIAERNIQESKDSEKQPPTPKNEQQKDPSTAPSTATKKKRNVKDLSHLPPDEIARRNKQRQLQIEAAERRARGEDLSHGHKHPLNSERRRANRRKPARKSQGNARRDFNSVGYQMRKSG